MFNKSVTINDLKDDELFIIFSYLDLRHQFSSMAVSKRWNCLIRLLLLVRKSVSFVDNKKGLEDWFPEEWLELTQCPKQYEKVTFKHTKQLVSNIISKFPNLKSVDMECFTMDSTSLELLSTNCPKLERLNLDSCEGFTLQMGRYFQTHFQSLKYLNVSCVSEITEGIALKILRSRLDLIALNVCGTQITGQCLALLPPSVEYVNISYCWKLQVSAFSALVSSKCLNLKQLVANNFDSPASDQSLTEICDKFKQLKCLDISLGNCTEKTFHLNSFTNSGFSSIARLKQLQSLTIKKVCILDDLALLQIIQNCPLISHLAIDMRTETMVTDYSIALISRYLKSIESLEISGNHSISDSAVIAAITGLSRLNKLVLFDMSITNNVIKFAAKNCPHLRQVFINRCHRVSKPALNEIIERAKRSPSWDRFHFEAINTRILIRTIVRNRVLLIKNLPPNLSFKVSNIRGGLYFWFNSTTFGYNPKPKWV